MSNSRIVGDDYQKMVLTVGDETPTISSTGIRFKDITPDQVIEKLLRQQLLRKR